MEGQKPVEQMTQEELQKTQVLNLKDVEEVARIEKRTSKKPAIIVAAIGIFSILIGSTIPFTQSLTAKDVEEPKRKVENKKTLISESYLNCTFTTLNNTDGTDTVLNTKLTFSYNKLTKMTKTFSINPTVGNPKGPQRVKKYITDYQKFLNPATTGYQVSLNQVEKGIVVSTDVDLLTFDPVSLPEINKSHFSTNVDFQVNTEKEFIYNDLVSKGFTCEIENQQ